MINEDQEVIIRTTFTTIASHADSAGQIFYARLFEIEPSLRSLFNVEIDKQGHHFMLALSAVVTAIAAPDIIKPLLRQLGKRHIGYGVRNEHYAIAKRALLDTLQVILEDEYTLSVHNAWSELYDWLVTLATEEAYT